MSPTQNLTQRMTHCEWNISQKPTILMIKDDNENENDFVRIISIQFVIA